MSTPYNQFCALARAAEILGERWTLLIIRELMLGPKRFSDLKGRLDGISASVLSQRLARMEENGLIERAYLEPPAASNVFQLTETGHALEPAIFALIRWGGRLLMPARPGERREPEWVRLVLAAFAREGRVPRKSFELHVRENGGESRAWINGTTRGTVVSTEERVADVTFGTGFETLLGMMSGRLETSTAIENGLIDVEGDTEALADFPKMFNPNGEGRQ